MGANVGEGASHEESSSVVRGASVALGPKIWLSLLPIRSMMGNGASFWEAFSGRTSRLAFPKRETARL